MGFFSKPTAPITPTTETVSAGLPALDLALAPPPPPAATLLAKPNQPSVEEFVKQQPLAVYTIDGLQNASESTICRPNANGGVTCLKLGFNAVSLFRKMQTLEYFCSLPAEVKATHFECRLIQ